MRIIVSGEIGVGKTTVCEKAIGIAREAGYRCSGILTPKVIKDGIVRGIDVVDIQNGERETLAAVDSVYKGPHVGKYFFNPEGIRFGIRAIEKGIASDLLVVDEIGPLELAGEGFFKALEVVRAGIVRNSVLVIRKHLLTAFLPRLGAPPSIFEVTIENRKELPQKIISSLEVG